jgi:hypothetical protein
LILQLQQLHRHIRLLLVLEEREQAAGAMEVAALTQPYLDKLLLVAVVAPLIQAIQRLPAARGVAVGTLVLTTAVELLGKAMLAAQV